MKTHRIFSIIAAVLSCSAVMATTTTLSPTLDVLYRANESINGWQESYPKLSSTDGATTFECKWGTRMFAIQQYEIPDFINAQTLVLTLKHGAQGQTNALAVWSFPYEMPTANNNDATAFFSNVAAVTGVAINDQSATFSNMLAASTCSGSTWTLTINAGSVKPYAFKEDGTTAVVQLLITTSAANAGNAGHYLSNNSANDADKRPGLEVEYYGEIASNYPVNEMNYRFIRSEAGASSWNFIHTNKDNNNFETNMSAWIFTVEQFIIDDYDPANIYTLTLSKYADPVQKIAVWDFPYALPMNTAVAASSLVATVQTTTNIDFAAGTSSFSGQITEASCTNDKWTLTIPGYAMTPMYMSENKAVVNLLLTSSSKATYKTNHSYNVEGGYLPSLVKSGSYPVKNGSSYYLNLADAVSAASAGDVIELLDDVTISGSCLTITKTLTIQGATGAEKIICGVAVNTLMVLANGNEADYTVTFKNLIVDGQNAVRSTQLFDTNNKAKMAFDGVSVINTSYSVVTGDVKSNGSNIILSGTNSFPTGIYLNKNKRVDHQGATHTSPIKLILAADYVNGYAVVLNCTDAAFYTAVDAADKTDWELCKSDTKNELIGTTRLNLADNEDNASTLTTYNGQRVNVTLTRNIPSASYSTFCLPFDVPAEDVATKFNSPELVEYKDASIDNGTASLHFVDAADGIKAGVPYLIKPTGDITDPITFTGVTIDNTARPSADTHYRFEPTFSQVASIATEEEAAAQSVIYLGAGDQLYYAASGRSIKGFRGYFKAISAPACSAKRWVIGRGTPTSVENAHSDKMPCTKVLRDGQVLIIRDGVEYDLMGQMVR